MSGVKEFSGFIHVKSGEKPMVMDTYCFNCGQQGETTMLLIRIPFFRELAISHFECPHCNYSDNGVQFAGKFPPKGVKFTLSVKSPEDLDRRIVKSSYGVITIPQLNFEIPGPTQGDSINTIEGVLVRALNGIKMQNPEPTPEMSEFIDNLQQCASGLVQFDFILEDPSGNSFIENPDAPSIDPQLKAEFYKRTPEQQELVGLKAEPDTEGFELDDEDTERIDSVFAHDEHITTFKAECPVCGHTNLEKDCTLDIPYFKEIIIMSYLCEYCRYKNAEIKVGGGISPVGRRIALRCTEPRDLNREVIKSENAFLRIDELKIEFIPGSMAGKFTTVEGLIRDIHKNLKDNNPFARGDSSSPEAIEKYNHILSELKLMEKGEKPCTILIDDSLGNSFIQRYGKDDPNLDYEDYERTYEQNEALGINDMHVDNEE